jgi:hypothetical protein
MTSGEIAEHLVVTPRTVAFHLGSVYRKLGISGRNELPAALDSPADRAAYRFSPPRLQGFVLAPEPCLRSP